VLLLLPLDELVRLGVEDVEGVVLLGPEAVVDLGLVALLVFAGQAAEEDTAVEVFAVGLAFQLEDEVVPLLRRLQVAGAVLEAEPALPGDAELRLAAG